MPPLLVYQFKKKNIFPKILHRSLTKRINNFAVKKKDKIKAEKNITKKLSKINKTNKHDKFISSDIISGMCATSVKHPGFLKALSPVLMLHL